MALFVVQNLPQLAAAAADSSTAGRFGNLVPTAGVRGTPALDNTGSQSLSLGARAGLPVAPPSQAVTMVGGRSGRTSPRASPVSSPAASMSVSRVPRRTTSGVSQTSGFSGAGVSQTAAAGPPAASQTAGSGGRSAGPGGDRDPGDEPSLSLPLVEESAAEARAEVAGESSAERNNAGGRVSGGRAGEPDSQARE